MELEVAALHLLGDGGKRLGIKGHTAIRQLDRERAGVIARVADGLFDGSDGLGGDARRGDVLIQFAEINNNVAGLNALADDLVQPRRGRS